MIIIALGSNIAGPWGTPHQTVQRALKELNTGPLQLVKASTLIETEPFGVLDQPHFVNGVAIIETALLPVALIEKLHAIEQLAGRRRLKRWGPRTLDLDIIDYDGVVLPADLHKHNSLVLPHPSIAERSFVLEPIQEIAPEWQHPLTQETPLAMIQKLYRLKGN
jgi:2-amino-4-hydroxy-6-hydroxymethyldihydropteridine diphosphokinase